MLANILIVEDERIVARDIQTTLERAGYQVVGNAVSGAQAVLKAAETQPDLVLMDIVLAGEIDGIEAARQIRRQRDIPIIYLTANGDRAVIEKAKATEPIAFILKPYEDHELLTSIEVALHRYQVQRQRAREVLKESEARFRELFETARDGIAITDLTGRHQDCNQAYLQLLGYASAGELLPYTLSDLTPPEFQETEARLIREQTLPLGFSEEYEKEALRKDGTRLAVSSRTWLRKDGRGQPLGFWVILRDVSERKEAESQIQEYQKQLQALMARLSVAEERERQRIATDIHDRISQTLAVCQMRLECLAQSIPDRATASEMEAVCGLLDRTLQDTSSLIFELSPPVLHQLGLAPALEWLGEKIQNQHGLIVTVTHTSQASELTEDQRNALFRAASELMNNVVKHGHAKNMKVTLDSRDGALVLAVEDDGVGIKPANEAPGRQKKGGFGLFHIRERMRAWNGGFEISPNAAQGTRAVLSLPLGESVFKS